MLQTVHLYWVEENSRSGQCRSSVQTSVQLWVQSSVLSSQLSLQSSQWSRKCPAGFEQSIYKIQQLVSRLLTSWDRSAGRCNSQLVRVELRTENVSPLVRPHLDLGNRSLDFFYSAHRVAGWWCEKNYGGGFSQKNPVFPDFGPNGPKTVKNRLFSILLKIGSKDFLDIMHLIRGHYCAHFAENRMFGKNPVPELWTEKTEK